VYSITGTPASSGTASFTVTIGGQTCTFTIPVALPLAAITSLSCGTASTSGTLVQNTVATGVTSTIPYTGGNGGTYTTQSVSSTGVLGLTASRTSGTLATGAGNVVYTISGTPTTSGTASFAISIGGQSCTLTLPVLNVLAAQYPSGSVFCASGPTVIVDVTNPITGRTWMDRNLGATQVATTSTDVNSYGDLYQWGRGSDGHQCRTSATTTTLSSTDQPGNGNFILAPNTPSNWRSPQNANLWQGVNGVNNPCPSTYRLPTDAELEAERISWNASNSAGAFASTLKLTIAGQRRFTDGSMVSNAGYYWSSTVSSSGAVPLFFNGSNASIDVATNSIAFGRSVRCIKN
jgi:uncharacterized protein (TIGR02145 family)